MYINEKFLNYAFKDEIIVPQNCGNITIKKQNLGLLNLPTGKIVANDPCVFFETEEFTVKVEPGIYPVSISIAEFSENGDKVVAFAMIKFSGSKPVKWAMALIDGQGLECLSGDSFYGYGVDSGVGGFMDKSIADKVLASDLDLYDIFEGQFNKTHNGDYSYASGNITGSGNSDIIAFSSGYGDGAYPSYFGYDESGKVCSLVTEFFVIEG
ncbi:MAG: DUF4241 domain-containing protein [Clostridiales bacterium]|jgi:hypothetical protein|nr:DUF4241 domain-containing protein [Clostridiales bacterium]